jgi:carboxylesterase type B
LLFLSIPGLNYYLSLFDLLILLLRESATANANDIFAYLGCDNNDVACMRTKTPEEVLEAQNKAVKLNLDNLFINFLPFSPMVETGGRIEEQPFDALAAGRMQKMPILSGTVLDEGQLFVYELFTKPVNKAAYDAILLGVFGRSIFKQLAALYPYDMVEGADDGRATLNVLATDLLFYCPLRNATRGYQKTLGAEAVPTYTYRFDHIISFDCWGPDYWFCVGYVCHGSELPFEFNVFTDGVSLYYEPTADEVQLTTDTTHLFTNFIASGNPNTGLAVPDVFPLYNAKTDGILILEEPTVGVKYHQREVFCDFWDQVGYYY